MLTRGYWYGKNQIAHHLSYIYDKTSQFFKCKCRRLVDTHEMQFQGISCAFWAILEYVDPHSLKIQWSKKVLVAKMTKIAIDRIKFGIILVIKLVLTATKSWFCLPSIGLSHVGNNLMTTTLLLVLAYQPWLISLDLQQFLWWLDYCNSCNCTLVSKILCEFLGRFSLVCA